MLRVRNFLSDESGVTAIEYALIASLIAVFIIVAVQLVGTQVSTVFNEIGNYAQVNREARAGHGFGWRVIKSGHAIYTARSRAENGRAPILQGSSP